MDIIAHHGANLISTVSKMAISSILDDDRIGAIVGTPGMV